MRTGTACGHLLLREFWSPVLRAGCPLLTQEVLRSPPGSLLPRLVSLVSVLHAGCPEGVENGPILETLQPSFLGFNKKRKKSE